MRRRLVILVMVATSMAEACSWPPDAPNPIERSLRFSNICEAVLVATMGISLLAAIRHHRGYGFPCAMAVLAGLAKLAMGTAYSGDCGFTAVNTALVSAGLSVGGLNAQLVLALRRNKG